MLWSRRTNLFLSIASYSVLAVVIAFALFPLLWTFITSLKYDQDIITDNLQLIPQNPTLDNYVAIWNRSGFPTLVTNSAITTLITLTLCLTAGSLAAYSLSRYRFKGRTAILLLYLVIRMFPVVLLIVPLFIMMRALGLLDSRFGLALSYTTFLLPLCIWMMKGYFDAIPPDLEDAARIDGCTRLSALFRVVLPLARSGLIATGAFIGISAWNEFLFALMMTSSQGSRTWPVGLQLMIGEFQLPWGRFAAGGIISVIPVLILFAAVQRTLIKGLTAGAIKG